MKVKSMEHISRVEVLILLTDDELAIIHSALGFRAEHGEQNSKSILDLRSEIENLIVELHRKYRL